jgi:hypothetical protein
MAHAAATIVPEVVGYVTSSDQVMSRSWKIRTFGA